jgi:peptidylprolyl isomerase
MRMTKNIFIFILVITIVGVAVWFFVQKANNVPSDADLGTLVGDNNEPTPTPSSDKMENTGENWVTLPNGLKILDVVIGPGREAKEGDIVAAHYSGTLDNGTKFDSSYDRGEPYAFILGAGQVIKGWDFGLVGMKVGGKRKLIIPPSLGYGDRGAGGAIGPGATLHFDIELMAVETPKN